MARFKILVLVLAILSYSSGASLDIHEQKLLLRVRRQDSTLQQTLEMLQGQRRRDQSGNLVSGQNQGFGNQGQGPNRFNNNQGQNFGSNQGQGFGNRPNQGIGFGNQGQGSNGFGNQGQGSNGFGNQGSNSFGNQGQGSNGFGNNQGGSNSGTQGGQFGWTTQRPPVNLISNENSIDAQTSACIRNCGVVNNYNPVCGNDNITYQNPQKLQCVQQQCNREVQMAYNGACVTTRAPNRR